MFVLLAGSSGRILTESAAVPHKRQVIMYSCATKEQEQTKHHHHWELCRSDIYVNSFTSLLGYYQILKDLFHLWLLQLF